MSRPGSLVISLDFELFWGVRDITTIADYGENLLGVREVVPALLDLFAEYEVHATWATVGLLFARTRDEMEAFAPATVPAYTARELSPYPLDVGSDESADPYRYGRSLIDLIRRSPHQEIATHTFSHYYCLEAGQDMASFEADLDAALAVADAYGVALRSIVFPRNQVNREYLHACADRGLIAYRDTEPSRIFRPRPAGHERRARRLVRLIDTYAPVLPLSTGNPERVGGLWALRSSRYLRPASPRWALLDGVKIRRIASGLEGAARRGTAYHLWWHPHDFGRHPELNLAMTRRILEHYARLRRAGVMRSMTMAELAADAATG